MMGAGEGVAQRRHQFVVQMGQGRTLVIVSAYMQGLQAEAFFKNFMAKAGRDLAQFLRRLGDGSLQLRWTDPVRRADHHRPPPLILAASHKARRILGGPQGFQRWHHVVLAPGLQRELQCIAHRVQPLHGLQVGGGDIRITVAVDHHVGQGRYVHCHEPAPRGLVQRAIALLEIDLVHGAPPAPSIPCIARAGMPEHVQATLPNTDGAAAIARCQDAAPGCSARRGCAVRQRVAARNGPFLRSIIVNAFLKWWVTA